MDKLIISYTLNRYTTIIVLAIFIAIHLVAGIYEINNQSITSDEEDFYNYANRYLHGHPNRIIQNDDSKMPVCALNLLPRITEQLFNKTLKKNDGGKNDIIYGRYITLFSSIFIILLVFYWAKELYGKNAGLFAAFLISCCPNTLGNAVLITADCYASLALLAVLLMVWKFCIAPSWRTGCLLSIAVALAQLVKQSLFHLYILIPVLLLCYFTIHRTPVKWKHVISGILVFIFINWLCINAGYYFYETNQALSTYHFKSDLFKQVSNHLPANLICPLPRPFIQGLDMSKYADQTGEGFGKVTILGRESMHGSFWYYYIVSFFYKTPVAYFIFLAGALIFLIRSNSWISFLKREFFLLTPVIYYLVIFSLFYKTQCGIRHIIFFYPLLLIVAAAAWHYTAKNNNCLLGIAVCSYLLISVGCYYQNMYAYTNEFIPDKKMAYAYVGSANLDFRQGQYYFDAYLAKHPSVQPAPLQAMPGTYLISVEDYMDVWDTHKYEWLKKFKPVDQVAYCGLIFSITPGELKIN